MKFRDLAAAALVMALAAPAIAGPASTSISIVSGIYREQRGDRQIDVSDRIQEICGPNSHFCEFFCANSTFGSPKLKRKKMCRITYRCGGEVTRATEADEDDPVVLRCTVPASE